MKSILQLKKLQEKKLDKAAQHLNMIPFDPKLAPPLPIEDLNRESIPKAASKHSSSHLKSMNGGNLQKIDKVFPSLTVDLTPLSNESDDDSIAIVPQGMVVNGPTSNWREH